MRDFNQFMKRLEIKETDSRKAVPGEDLRRYRENYDAAFADYEPKGELCHSNQESLKP